MSWYAPSAVPGTLGELVTGWVARAEGRQQLILDGCVDVLWIGDGSAWVCGAETAA